MSKDLQKYENWQAITESDFVTMFIKTWFAFVATLREMYPDISVFTEDGKPRGDRPFTNEYKLNHLKYVSKYLDIKELTDQLYDLYLPSRLNVAKFFPQYFFTAFYRINEDFHYTYESTQYTDTSKTVIKDRLHIDMVVVDRFNVKGVIELNGKYYQESYFESVKFKINIKPFIEQIDYLNQNNLIDSNYLNIIYATLINELERIVNLKAENILLNCNYSNRTKGIIIGKLNFGVSTIKKNFNFNFLPPLTNTDKSENDYKLIIQRPFNLFSEFLVAEKTRDQMDYCYNCIRIDGTNWFMDFVVGLRNALFHEIIDPLNKLWQATFKAAYSILKTFLDRNIHYLLRQKQFISEIKVFIKDEFIKKEIRCIDNYDTVKDISNFSIAKSQYKNGMFEFIGEFLVETDEPYNINFTISTNDLFKIEGCSYQIKTVK